ncbi:MAG: response regulator [Spirochaetia bacterium]|nr:response regulator [Spirochaetia bacterium]
MREPIVLIVDDEEDILEELDIFLRGNGLRVVCATSGKDAVSLFAKLLPHMVVTDFRMPGMDGLEVLRRVKGIHRATPVILISGNADMKTTVLAIKEEAFDFIAKPLDMDELLGQIHRALSERDAKLEGGAFFKGSMLGHEFTGNRDSISLLTILHPIDEQNRQYFQKELEHFRSNAILRDRIVVNLQPMNYINNVGLNVLIDLHDQCKREGSYLIFTQVTDKVLQYLKYLGYNEYFTIEQSLPDALKSCGEMKVLR